MKGWGAACRRAARRASPLPATRSRARSHGTIQRAIAPEAARPGPVHLPILYLVWQIVKDKFQITRFLRFASQITRRTIFSCLARFPSNQFTQSPTIRVSAYPVAKICHVRLPGRPNFSSRLPGNDIFRYFPAQQQFHQKTEKPVYPVSHNSRFSLPGR